MKTVKSQKLFLKSGRPRIFELEIAELSSEDDKRYVVNYRYGFVRGELQEGTRTLDPVDLGTAEQLFDSLILSRRNQGYLPPEDGKEWLGTEGTKPQPVNEDVSDPRTARLMYLLQQINNMPDETASQLIWRVGQLRLKEAAQLLAAYQARAGEMASRVLPYALYRCSGQQIEMVKEALAALAASSDGAVADAGRIALSCLSDAATESEILRTRLPGSVGVALTVYLDADNESEKEQAIEQILGYLSLAVVSAHHFGKDYVANLGHGSVQQKTLIDLFLLSRHQPETRPLFMALLEQVPFVPFLFRALRKIFKAAEALDDEDIFALFSRRFDTESPAYRKPLWSRWLFVPSARKNINLPEELGKEGTRIAWSDKTRSYFRRRVWRNLRRLGQADDPTYVKLAVACLRQMNDDDQPEQTIAGARWVWQKGYTYTTIHFPPLCDRYAFHAIMHSNGQRLFNNGGQALRWKHVEGQKDASEREEPFRHLWDEVPDLLLDLMLETGSDQVRAFSARVLSDNPEFCANIPTLALARLLRLGGKAGLSFAVSVIRIKMANGWIDDDLIPVLFEVAKPEALELGQTILSMRPQYATDNCRLAAQLILAVSEASKEWLDQFWAKHAATSNLPYLFADIVNEARLKGWSVDNAEEDKGRMRLAADLLSQHFLKVIEDAPLEQLQDLAAIDRVPPQLLAILIAAHRPDRLLIFDPTVLAQSEDHDLRAAGAELLAHASIDELRAHEDLVVAFLLSEVTSSRQAARSAAITLAEEDEAAANRIAEKLLPALYRSEEHEGVREDLVATMQGPLLKAVVRHGPDLTWKLLRARSEPARRVGAAALQQMLPNAFSLRKIARIGNNDQLKARQWALNALDQRISDVQAKPEEIFSLLDGDWDDSREAAYDLVRNKLASEHWSPEAVIGLCDSISLPAQAFGRENLGKVFAQDNAEFFTTRLAEHPNSGFRLTIARLIREYAAGNPAHIRKVQFALRSILSRVFSSRAAKEQIFAFMDDEIKRGEPQTLELLAGLLTDISASCAIGDRARILELIAQIKAQTPTLVAEARILEPELRGERKAS